MNIHAHAAVTAQEIRTLTTPLLRFERSRGRIGMILLGALAGVALLALPPLPAATAVVCFLFMASLALTWSRRASRAGRAAERFAGDFQLTVTDRGMTACGPDTEVELPWAAAQQVTKSQAGWIFVGDKGRTAVPVPARLLSDAQAGQLHALLGTWSMRRYRHTPW